jgi:hypothetical protein
MGLRYFIYSLSVPLLSLAASAAPTASGGSAVSERPMVHVPSQAEGLMQRLPLTELAPYSIGINPQLPTTILLPDIPQAFTGVGFSKDKNTAAPVFIEHTPRTTWFTVRALMNDASAELNLLMGGKVYSFHFYFSTTPHRTLTLFTPKADEIRPAAHTAHITVKRLIDLLDEAKAYLAVKSHYPNLYRPIQFSAPGAITPYRDFDVVTDMIWKFPADDTLVFRIVFVNRSEAPLHYDPQAIGARIRGTPSAYWKSISDLDGVVPAARRIKRADGTEAIKAGQSFGYFAITSNPDGSKAGLSLKNNFDILVKREDAPAEPTTSEPARVLAPSGL